MTALQLCRRQTIEDAFGQQQHRPENSENAGLQESGERKSPGSAFQAALATRREPQLGCAASESTTKSRYRRIRTPRPSKGLPEADWRQAAPWPRLAMKPSDREWLADLLHHDRHVSRRRSPEPSAIRCDRPERSARKTGSEICTRQPAQTQWRTRAEFFRSASVSNPATPANRVDCQR